jgi:hypothetical protein
MTLWALTPQGEASVPLKPNERSDRYLKRVREQLSGHALGSPGGYPVHLTRWTRQSQAGLSNQHLAQLLLIAEEEAVVAVVHSPALTDELARYAWWCMPTIENARLMLMRDVVCQGSMGRTLAEFLVEHLAFLHEDDVGILDTVAVMLYSGVLTDAERLAIWKRGSSRNSYYVPFLELQPDNLPSPRAARADHASVPQLAGNPYSVCWTRPVGPGADLHRHHRDHPRTTGKPGSGEPYAERAGAVVRAPAPGRRGRAQRGARSPAQAAPQFESDCAALDALAAADADSVRPIFLKTTAIGSLMRRKIQPVVTPLLDAVAVLRRQP